jgi:3-oxoacyl-[acyl-carrier-protein] synthase II
MKFANIPANQVLVTVGNGFGASSMGTTETQRAAMIRDPRMIGFAAFDARLVDIDTNRSTAANPVFTHREGDKKGESISTAEIESRWGSRLREEMGIRFLNPEQKGKNVPTDIAAPLAHRFSNPTGEGSLRERLGVQFGDFAGSPLASMKDQFRDNASGPSLQTLLFLAGAGALASLSQPLSTLVPHAFRFQIAAGCCFAGQDSQQALELALSTLSENDPNKDEAARRLAASLNTHGPSLLTRMLSPSYPLRPTQKKTLQDPKYLRKLRSPGDPYFRNNVPRSPVVVSAACASAFFAFSAIAPYLQMGTRFNGIDACLWLSADAPLLPFAQILEGFGPAAMMNREKIGKSGRLVSDCLAPFDADGDGTVVGSGSYGQLIMSLESAIFAGEDITSVITGWGTSSETGGNGHSAGVGFGGDNAIKDAYIMALLDHGYGVNDFEHKIAHGTGTNTNSTTDLAGFHQARLDIAEAQGVGERLIRMTVGAPKALVGHEMGVAGHRATEEGTHYLMGSPTVGVPTLRKPGKGVEKYGDFYSLSADPVPGNTDGGLEEDVQGFGGFDGAMLRRSANERSLRRYRSSVDDVKYQKALDAYLEAWPQKRAERIEREAKAHRELASVRRLIEGHRWRGDE